MTLLSGAEIRRILFHSTTDAERLVVTPLLDVSQVSEDFASIDVRLGSLFRVARRSNTPVADMLERTPSSQGQRPVQQGESLEEHYVRIGEAFVLHPRHFALGMTLEYLRIPFDCGCYVVGRSTWGRQGLVIATAVGVHPGFAGNLALELTNLAEIPLRLYPGTRIAQLFLHRLDSPTTGDSSAYVGSTRPEAGLLSTDTVTEKIVALRTQRENAQLSSPSGAGAVAT